MSSYNIEDSGVEAKKRYWEKLHLLNMRCCPYQLPADA